jgi:ABC-2 type transport system permease protein
MKAVYMLFGGFGGVFWVGLFFGLLYVLHGFLGVEVFGPLLVRKLLELLLLSLFFMLVFSNVVTALSTWFLSDDLELLLSLPVPRPNLHYNRLLETLLQSSWMMAFFGLPVFLAYGVAMRSPWSYYAVLVLVIPAFVVIPAGLGAAIASLLVNVFPARRTREFMAFLGILALVAIFLVIRVIRPERLVDAEGFESLAAYMAELQAPVPFLLPPRWASDVLLAALEDRGIPFLTLAMLLTGAAAILGLSRWVVQSLHASGWSRAQEARAPRGAGAAWFRSLVHGFSRFFPVGMRPLVIKDVRTFVRDPAQWSQIFLLASLIVIYLFSVRALPVDQFHGVYILAFKRSIAFLNLGMAGFVMAGIAIRFQFSAVSGEGRAFWILRASPFRGETFLWAKSLVGLLPMLCVGEILAVVSSHILDAGPFLSVLCALTAFGLACGMSGLGVALGAIYPNFKADNASRAAASPAGVLFMVVALMLAGLVLALEALPVWLVLRSGMLGIPITGWQWLGLSLPLVVAALLCFFAAIWPIRWSARALWARGA